MDGTRSDQVLALVRAGGRVPLGELAGRLGVSEMTIRRDLDALSAQGLVRRVRGAAVALGGDGLHDGAHDAAEDDGGRALAQRTPPPTAEPDPERRPTLAPVPATPPAGHPAAPPAATPWPPAVIPPGGGAADDDVDERCAAAILPLLAPGTSVLLDAGPVSAAIARRLHAHRDLTVAVTDLTAAADLSASPGVRLIVLGGERRPGEAALVGPLALAALDGLSFDVAVLAAAGVQPGAGWTTTSAERADLHRAVLARAERVVLTAAPPALGRRALARASGLEAVSTLVTAVTSAAGADVARSARSEGVEVVLV